MKKEKSVRMAELKEAALKQLKSLIFPLILCAIIVGGIIFVVNYQNVKEPTEVIRINGYDGSDKPIVIDNEELKLTMDPLTTQFSVEVKSSGKVWYSNPQDASSDTIALSSERGNLLSTLLLTYSKNTGLETTFNNYDYSIENGIYEIESGDDYISVKYSIGDVDKEFVIPPVTTKANMEKWTSKMDTSAKNTISKYYKKYDIKKLGKKDNKEELLANYPIIESEVIYVLRDATKDPLKQKMEEFFEAAGYTMEDYAADKELDMSVRSSDKPVFNVQMNYRLKDGDLVVEVPLESLEYLDDSPIYTITLLPYFGAGGTQDDGFLLVPEGGGAIINFNNGKTAQNSYVSNVYGWDMNLGRKAIVHNTRAFFNTFGVSEGNDAFICLLGEGAPYAAVQADISGRYNSYNYANACYSICVREQYDVSEIANSDVYVYLKDLPNETLTQTYRFVDSGSYVDMAKEYQGYLKETYDGYFEKNDDTDTPVAIEIVGAVDKVKQVLGVPVSRPLKLTTYKEAGQMVSDLKSEGMNNLFVKFTGWTNGGEKQKILKKVKTIPALGSKSDLKKMVQTADALDIPVYLDGVTDYAYDSKLTNGFFSFTDAARMLTKERAELCIYSDVTYSAREGVDTYYLLNQANRMKMANNLKEAASKYGAGVSFREIGIDLSSDFTEKQYSSRQNALYEQQAFLKAMADNGQKIMINMGNDYAIMYSDMVTGMDLKGSEYTILDADIPFYQLAIHGFVDYTGEPLNICGDTQEELLLSAEYGAGLSFTLMKESAFALQKTLYTEYYGADYSAWHDRMMEIYQRYNDEMGNVFHQEMTGHEKLSDSVSVTTYEDGTKVYVNYGYADATADGTKIPARDYKVVK